MCVCVGAMAMKGYSAFPKASALRDIHHHIGWCHIQETNRGRVIPLYREAVSVFYSPSRLENHISFLCQTIVN